MATPATPPTTPPAMAPTFVPDDGEDVAAGVGSIVWVLSDAGVDVNIDADVDTEDPRREVEVAEVVDGWGTAISYKQASTERLGIKNEQPCTRRNHGQLSQPVVQCIAWVCTADIPS
ncbi:hypothetical protein IFM5058_02583 [Aspergillus udagawae]|nr:hypothetical protein IFM5058_02583 [Aspergillus udagawae]